MKKIICLVTALTITAASCVTMAAAKDNEEQVKDAEIMVIAPAPEDIMVISPAPSEAEEILGTPQITVDGEKVDLSKTKLSHYMYTENENTLVPLRAVAEKMGYDVDWNNEEKKAVDFDAKALTESPEGYEVADISVMSGKMLQIVYESGDKKITYRTMKGTEDISGDYNVYENEEEVLIKDEKVLLSGNSELFFKATYIDKQDAYSISCFDGLTKEEFIKIIESCK